MFSVRLFLLIAPFSQRLEPPTNPGLFMRYACRCKECAKNAPMPAHPLSGAQVTPVMIAHTMVSKLLDGLPLYRQEKMAARDGLDLSRAKLARLFIGGSRVFQPILNGLMDEFFSYDIALSDDTRIKVLKNGERQPKYPKRPMYTPRRPSGQTGCTGGLQSLKISQSRVQIAR